MFPELALGFLRLCILGALGFFGGYFGGNTWQFLWGVPGSGSGGVLECVLRGVLRVFKKGLQIYFKSQLASDLVLCFLLALEVFDFNSSEIKYKHL